MSNILKSNLSRVTTKNYRNLVNEEGIELNNLNILIGSNGSGKSNLVAILEFFKNCLTPSADLESRGVTAFQDAMSKLGNNMILNASIIERPATVEFEFEFPCLHSPSGLLYKISFCIDKSLPVPFINTEILTNIKGGQFSAKPFIYYQSHNQQIGKCLVSLKNEKTSETRFEKLHDIPTNELSLISIPKRLIKDFNISPEKIPLYKAQRDLEDFVKKWQFYNGNQMNLSEIRGANPKVGRNDVILAKSGNNLLTVLDNLISDSKYGLDFEERINNSMKEILPATRKIKTTREGMSLSVQWHFDGMETSFRLDDMSDGTVRMLCWAVILHSPILPSLLVIDEPELGLHVAWMVILAHWIKRASQKTQVIISTHSPDLLDYFTDCAKDVICFDKTLPKGHFKAKKLPEAMIQEKIAEGWHLGDLYRMGDIIGGWPW